MDDIKLDICALKLLLTALIFVNEYPSRFIHKNWSTSPNKLHYPYQCWKRFIERAVWMKFQKMAFCESVTTASKAPFKVPKWQKQKQNTSDSASNRWSVSIDWQVECKPSLNNGLSRWTRRWLLLRSYTEYNSCSPSLNKYLSSSWSKSYSSKLALLPSVLFAQKVSRGLCALETMSLVRLHTLVRVPAQSTSSIWGYFEW